MNKGTELKPMQARKKAHSTLKQIRKETGKTLLSLIDEAAVMLAKKYKVTPV